MIQLGPRRLAELTRGPVIVLSDQFIAQRRETLSMLTLDHEVIGRQVPSAGELREYKRYKETKSGISPMSEGLFFKNSSTGGKVNTRTASAPTR